MRWHVAYEFKDLDCLSFVQVRRIEDMKQAESDDGLRHELEFHGEDGTYIGTAPQMLQHSVLNFLLREKSIADARKRGYRWR
jgi:hypothetical protein